MCPDLPRCVVLSLAVLTLLTVSSVCHGRALRKKYGPAPSVMKRLRSRCVGCGIYSMTTTKVRRGDCVLGNTFWFAGTRMWVDDGCSARFKVCDKRKSPHHDPQDDDGEDNNVEVDVTTTKSPEDRPKVVKYLQHIGWFSRSTP